MTHRVNPGGMISRIRAVAGDLRPQEVARRRRWRSAAGWVYYGSLCVLVGLCASKTLTQLISGPVGKHIADDSEGYVLALLLPLWIEFVRPRLAGRGIAWPVTA